MPVGPPYPVANSQAPAAVVLVDPGSGNQISTSSQLPVTQPAGARQPTSAQLSYLDVRTVANARILSTTNSTNFAAGVCTGVGGAAGVAGDTFIQGIIFLPNSAAVTATLVGCQDDTGAAANYVFSGDTAALDAGSYYQPLGIVNDFGPLSITASVASKVIVLTRPA